MSYLEQEIMNTFDPACFILWLRYVDDIWFLFHGSHTKLEKFLEHMNKFHSSIKFTSEYSKNSVNFLDVKIYKDKQGKLQTTLYKKSSKQSLYLHYDSFHPPHIFRNIVYSQCIRLCTIISTRENRQIELSNLQKSFISRGYPKKMVNLQIAKALTINRSSLLMNRPKPQTKHKLVFKMKHSILAKYHRQNIRNIWKTHIKDPKLKSRWPNPPSFCSSKSKCLKDFLVHSKQK